MNLIGLITALYVNIAMIAGINDPQMKVSPVGFLKMLLDNNATTEVVNLSELRAGQKQALKVRYMQRGTEADATDRDDCETSVTAEWKTVEIGYGMYSKIGIFISDDQMHTYEEQATKTQAAQVNGVNTLEAPLMVGLYQTLLTKINGLVQKIDSNLVTAMASKWGVNAAYGDNNPHVIEFGTTASMNDGVVKLLSDAEANEVAGDLLVCGNGVVRQFDLYNRFKNGFDAAGIGSMGLNTYVDPKTATKWGANHFGVFAKGSIGFVPWNKNVANYAGVRGTSAFFTLPMPVQLANGELSQLMFDCQLKYHDCPIYDESTHEKVADRGWVLLVGLNYGLFVEPTDAFASTDPLYGVNGAFHYIATAKDDATKVRPADGATFHTCGGDCPSPSSESASQSASASASASESASASGEGAA